MVFYKVRSGKIRKDKKIRVLVHLLHCWQKRWWIPETRTTGALAWNSHTLWRLWYRLASVISTVQFSAWHETAAAIEPQALDPFLPLFFFSSSPNPNPLASSSSSSSSSSSTSFLLFPSALLVSILREGRGGENKSSKIKIEKKKKKRKNTKTLDEKWVVRKEKIYVCEDHRLHFYSLSP